MGELVLRPGELWTRELMLPIISCRTREGGPCTLPGQHSRTDPIDGRVGDRLPDYAEEGMTITDARRQGAGINKSPTEEGLQLGKQELPLGLDAESEVINRKAAQYLGYTYLFVLTVVGR
ncbi:hypothetical protein STEG23_027815 [Scotinomys teguina]